MKQIILQQLMFFAIIAAIKAASTWYYETAWNDWIRSMITIGIGLTAIGVIRILWASLRNRTAKD